jgi:hypothetical protein
VTDISCSARLSVIQFNVILAAVGQLCTFLHSSFLSCQPFMGHSLPWISWQQDFYRVGQQTPCPAPNLEDHASIFVTSRDRMTQLYSQELYPFLVIFYDMLDLRWDYYYPPVTTRSIPALVTLIQNIAHAVRLNGVRLCPWTAATNVPIVHPQMICLLLHRCNSLIRPRPPQWCSSILLCPVL